jgi:hypothetical protein
MYSVFRILRLLVMPLRLRSVCLHSAISIAGRGMRKVANRQAPIVARTQSRSFRSYAHVAGAHGCGRDHGRHVLNAAPMPTTLPTSLSCRHACRTWNPNQPRTWKICTRASCRPQFLDILRRHLIGPLRLRCSPRGHGSADVP